MRQVRGAFEAFTRLDKSVPPEMRLTVNSIEEPSQLADTLIPQLKFKLGERQYLLELVDPARRLEKIYAHLQGEIEILEVERKIKGRVKKQMERSQKEYYLNEQMQAIQKELGDKDELRDEMGELEARIREDRMPAPVQTRLLRELRKLKLMSPMSAEANVVRTYIDTVLGLPWGTYDKDRLDISHAAKVLERDRGFCKGPRPVYFFDLDQKRSALHDLLSRNPRVVVLFRDEYDLEGSETESAKELNRVLKNTIPEGILVSHIVEESSS
jgi:ATP-dependent Lon protease